MKLHCKRILCLILTFCMMVSAAACGKSEPESPITIDQNGVATWDAVPNAVHYECNIVDGEYVCFSSHITTEPSIQVPQGFSVHLRAVFADGATGEWMISNYFGEPINASQSGGNMPSNENGDSIFQMDNGGNIQWSPIQGAVAYQCGLMDPATYAITYEFTLSGNSFRLPWNYCLEVRAVYEDGSLSAPYTSPIYGDATIGDSQQFSKLIDMDYTVTWDNVKSYDLIANIHFDSVTKASDGTVHFTAQGPKGETMRYVGLGGVTVENGTIRLKPGAQVYGLDSIGRICAYKPHFSDHGSPVNHIDFLGGYSFDGSTSVDSFEELFPAWPMSISVEICNNELYSGTSLMNQQCNMVGFGADSINNRDDLVCSEFWVYYDETTYATAIDRCYLLPSYYGVYLEGEYYDPSKEVYNPSQGIYTFYLMLLPQLANRKGDEQPAITMDEYWYQVRSVQNLSMDRYTIGNLKDSSGKVLDKGNAKLALGSTLEVTVAGQILDAELPIVPVFEGGQNLYQLSPSTRLPADHAITTLVVPVVWSDCEAYATEEYLTMLRSCLGRVTDGSSSVDYSKDIQSFSAYYDAVSRNQHHVESFVTDFYYASITYEQSNSENVVTSALSDEIIHWAMANYPQIDWSQFDANKDNIIDSVIFASVTPEDDQYFIASFNGGVAVNRGYSNNLALFQDTLTLNNFICIGGNLLKANGATTIIHEYGHLLGLIDYYDVSQSGINAVGQFDMQSDNAGDWNAYSKYAVGWIEPHVVTGLAPGESVEYTIGAQSDTGDAIVIPAAGTTFQGPFSEYILVDLFTDSGVNKAYTPSYRLTNTTGVRIYHVNAFMEYREQTNIYNETTPLGTVHHANEENGDGRFHIELIQAGGTNTFTNGSGNLRTRLQPSDLFQAGSVFTAEAYSQFLENGRMDDRSEFGYTIQIVSIDKSGENPTATIRITRK